MGRIRAREDTRIRSDNHSRTRHVQGEKERKDGKKLTVVVVDDSQEDNQCSSDRVERKSRRWCRTDRRRSGDDGILVLFDNL